MDGKGGLGMRNWNFSDQASSVNSVFKTISDCRVHDGAILDGSSGVSEHQHAYMKMSAFTNRTSMVSEAAEFTDWVHQRNFLSATKASSIPIHADEVNPDMDDLADMNMVLGTPVDTPRNGELETKPSKIKKHPSAKKSNHVSSKVLRPKEPKKKTSPSTKKQSNSLATAKREKKNPDIVIDGTALDFSHVPTPMCSCTGLIRQCYRWGAGGWQSSCCTTSISEYPLPMSSSRPGARMAGRKMSNGAYLKLLQRLAAEGHDLSHPVDLKNHWARHGTNKFVTIR